VILAQVLSDEVGDIENSVALPGIVLGGMTEIFVSW
jgi:hypothetical protein